jgi:DnaJ family protein A protein 2
MYVKINVRFPEMVDATSIPLLEQALPPRDPLGDLGKDTTLEEVNLDTADTRSKNGFKSAAAAAAGDDAMDEDSEEPRVQCANQ